MDLKAGKRKRSPAKRTKPFKNPITDFKGMWKPAPKPISSMNRNELLKHIREFRDAWEKITSRNQDMDDDRINTESVSELRKHVNWYFSEQAKEIAEDWLQHL